MKTIDSKILLKVEKKTEAVQKIGSLTVPVEKSNDFEVAEVLSVGQAVKEVNLGDKVYIYPGTGKKFTHEGQEYRVITSSEIIVVL